MLAKLCYFFGAEDCQHFNSKNAWCCRENMIFEKKKQALDLDNIVTLEQKQVYVYIYMWL